MSTYAIGDIQGCHQPLLRLLDAIHFDPAADRLVLAGDLVNRGNDSLGVLRTLYSIRHCVESVLGNHDLHLLAVAAGSVSPRRKDTLGAILDAPDRSALLTWLQHRPLLVELPAFGAVMTHAGIPPQWDLTSARERARELEAVLRGPGADRYFDAMYGNTPDFWDDSLQDMDRLRAITNYFTRMRFLSASGRLELQTKGEADAPPPGYRPWFEYPNPALEGTRILFGHWAALEGRAAPDNVEALDTGCVWGGQLTALRLEDNRRFSCECGKN